MKRQNKKIYPNVVDGGVAIPLGNNFYFMRGRKHEFGGIDVGPNNKNGLEVEDGEVMQMGGKHVKVYSSLPILNGKSPAQLVMSGANPTKVFNAQERFKKVNKLNDDGSRKAKFGIRKKLGQKILDRVHADGYWGGTDGMSYALDQLISNKDGAPLKRIKEMDIVNDKYNNNIPLSEDEAVIFNSGILDRLDQIKQHRDALKLYLGHPQDFNTMEKSPYQGIVSKNRKAYQINGLLTDDYFDNHVMPNYAKWKSGKNSELVTNLGKTAQLHDQVYLNNAGMSEGYDKEKGHYISVFDTWDYNTKVAGKHGDNISKFIGGKPFDLYHRFYLDEWNDIPKEYKGAKWLPEVIVKPNGYHTNTINLEDSISFDASDGGFKYGGSKKTRFGLFTDLLKHDAKVKASSANFAQRLKDKNRAVIPDWEHKGAVANFKLGTFSDDVGHYVYPSIQEVNGKLIDYTRPPYRSGYAIEKAIENNDIVKFDNLDDAINYTENYKLINKNFMYGGNKHFTINGNIVNKTGYIPSTGERKKANMGTINKRQKAEDGKNIFSPRGLGIQASIAKAQADAWDKKYPTEDNIIAQQFIDDFGDPTVYSSIMSDNANAKRVGIDRGYRGNTGLGWVMPELPSINLYSYFNNKEDIVARGSVSNSSGDKQPKTKTEPIQLSPIPIKLEGVTVDPIKAPTKLTIKIPKIETKNKGAWWKDNGYDLISGVSKGIGSIGSYLINRNMLNDLKYHRQPTYIPQTKLKTKININPQLDAIARNVAETDRISNTNTASSKVANARKNLKRLEALDYRTQLYGTKENKETELINTDKLNQQSIAEKNIKAYNDWVEKKTTFDNTVREKQSENTVSLVDNLVSGVNDIILNRQKRKQFKQNLAAIMASHPNVSPELLESYGLDVFDNNKGKKSNTSKKINIKLPTKEELELMKTVRELTKEEIKRLKKTK